MKNPNGWGSVYNLNKKKKTDDGKKYPQRRKPWVAVTPAYIADGKIVKKSIGTFATRTEAMAALEAYRHKSPEELQNMKKTLAQIWDDYKRTNKYKNISKSTQDCYNAAFNKLAALHKKEFAKLRTGDFQAVIDDFAEQGKSYSSLHDIKLICGLMSEYAAKNDIIGKNYARYIELPKKEESGKRALTDLEVQKIKIGVKNNIPYAEWLLILCYTGWRISELLNLTQFQYDRKEKTLTGGNKTEAGKNRIVPIHPDIQPYVDKWANVGFDTIFCRKEVQRDKDGNVISEKWVKTTPDYFRKHILPGLLKALDLDPSIKPHECRHTFVTNLQKNGANKAYIQRLVGHSSKDVTDKIYTHADMKALRDTINMLNFTA